jgi:hypothetical protein
MKSVIEKVNDTQLFWHRARMAVMGRQAGLTWEEVGRMNIETFFQLLYLTEKQENERRKADNRRIAST